MGFTPVPDGKQAAEKIAALPRRYQSTRLKFTLVKLTDFGRAALPVPCWSLIHNENLQVGFGCSGSLSGASAPGAEPSDCSSILRGWAMQIAW